MSAETVYTGIRGELGRVLGQGVDQHTLERLTLLVLGILGSKSASPSQVAKAIHRLGVSSATPESLERRVRRIENDPEVCAALCLHPLAKAYLAWGRPRCLVLVVDATCQDERAVMLSVSVQYRGSALPLGFAVWPGNTPLSGDRFFPRVETLLHEVAPLLPSGVDVTVLADRAFGTPVFLDMVTALGWHYVVRVQGQTMFRDRNGRERSVGTMVHGPKGRAKGQGDVFKKRGWRQASVVVHWGRRHAGPLCLVSDLRPRFDLCHLYRKRYAIETMFRNYKTRGWHWGNGQVTDLVHLERLLVAMALAVWLTLCRGAQAAREILQRPATGRRRTRCYAGKHSLFTLGLERIHQMFHTSGLHLDDFGFCLDHWDAPNWQQQIHNHHAYTFVFYLPTPPNTMIERLTVRP